MPSGVIASSFALMSFVVAAIVGVLAGNTPSTIIGRAMLVMMVCWMLGMVLGGIAQKTVDAHIKAFKEAHPLPDETEGAAIAAPSNDGGQGEAEGPAPQSEGDSVAA